MKGKPVPKVTRAFFCVRVVLGIHRCSAVGGLIYTLRQMMGQSYAGGQDDVLREVDSVFYLVVGVVVVFALWFLVRR
jgi:hypothetical protein